MRTEDITVIVPTRNEEHNIAAFLTSVPDGLHVLLIDASEDRTADVALRVRPRGTAVLPHAGNISEARQFGLEVARTPWLLFTDADIVFAPDYFACLGGHCGVDVVYGPKLSRDRFQQYYQWFARAQWLSHMAGIPAASGSNLLIRRKVLLDIGGFDRRLSCNEDSEVVWRIRRAGFSVSFDPMLIVYARDHRRLERGLLGKTAHSMARCALLYADLMPSTWREADWGYWNTVNRGRKSSQVQQ
jgi:glycosyltransferase involved in cell wall biosynthesis